MRAVAIFAIAVFGLFIAAFFLLREPRVIEVMRAPGGEGAALAASLAPTPSPAPSKAAPLPNPPRVVKAVYATNWSAGNAARMNALINLIEATELNALVIDIKDFSGIVGYATDVPAVLRYRASERRIPDLAALLTRLHEKNIYVIGRIAVFQDQKLAAARPDLAALDERTGKPWRDRKGLTWIDAAARDAWRYTIDIARDAARRGFDEINFDYIRFPSDGDLTTMQLPFFNASTTRPQVLRSFFEYAARELKGVHLSADLFGLSVVEPGDLGIGQQFETAFPFFTTLAPMLYPSHYHSGFAGFREPAQHPYEVIEYSMNEALKRLITYDKKQRMTGAASSSESSVISHQSSVRVKLRPWLQDFDLGGTYDAPRVRDEIEAVYDAFRGRNRSRGAATSTASSPSGSPASSCGEELHHEFYGGWMLWSPENVYTKAALCPA